MKRNMYKSLQKYYKVRKGDYLSRLSKVAKWEVKKRKADTAEKEMYKNAFQDYCDLYSLYHTGKNKITC